MNALCALLAALFAFLVIGSTAHHGADVEFRYPESSTTTR